MLSRGLPVREIFQGDPAECKKWALWAKPKIDALILLGLNSPGYQQTHSPADGVTVQIECAPQGIKLIVSAGKPNRFGFFGIPGSSESWWGWGPPYADDQAGVDPVWGSPGVANPSYSHVASASQTQHMLRWEGQRWMLKRPVKQIKSFVMGGQIAAQVPDWFKQTVSIQGYQTGWLPMAMHGQNSYHYVLEGGGSGYNYSSSSQTVNIPSGSVAGGVIPVAQPSVSIPSQRYQYLSEAPQLGWLVSYCNDAASPIFVDGNIFVPPNVGADSLPLNLTQVVGIGVQTWQVDGERKSRLIGVCMVNDQNLGFVGNYRMFYTSEDWKTAWSCGDFYARNWINNKEFPITFFFNRSCTQAAGIGHTVTFRPPTGASGGFGYLYDVFYKAVVEPFVVRVNITAPIGGAPSVTVEQEDTPGCRWTWTGESRQDLFSGNAGGGFEKHFAQSSKIEETHGPATYTIAIGFVGDAEKRLRVTYDYRFKQESSQSIKTVLTTPNDDGAIISYTKKDALQTASVGRLTYRIGDSICADVVWNPETHDLRALNNAPYQVNAQRQKFYINLIAVDFVNDALFYSTLGDRTQHPHSGFATVTFDALNSFAARRVLSYKRNDETLHEEISESGVTQFPWRDVYSMDDYEFYYPYGDQAPTTLYGGTLNVESYIFLPSLGAMFAYDGFRNYVGRAYYSIQEITEDPILDRTNASFRFNSWLACDKAGNVFVSYWFPDSDGFLSDYATGNNFPGGVRHSMIYGPGVRTYDVTAKVVPPGIDNFFHRIGIA